MGNSTEARDSPVHACYNPSEYSPISGVYGGVDGAKGAVGNYSKSPASMALGLSRNDPQRGLQLIDIQNST